MANSIIYLRMWLFLLYAESRTIERAKKKKQRNQCVLLQCFCLRRTPYIKNYNWNARSRPKDSTNERLTVYGVHVVGTGYPGSKRTAYLRRTKNVLFMDQYHHQYVVVLVGLSPKGQSSMLLHGWRARFVPHRPGSSVLRRCQSLVPDDNFHVARLRLVLNFRDTHGSALQFLQLVTDTDIHMEAGAMLRFHR
jgi:hypothetical protein